MAELLDGARRAVDIPGGSQALARSEMVMLIIDGHRFQLRRPTLTGAILIKARSLVAHHDPDSQREDLIRLLSLVDDPRTMAGELKPSERRWLRDVEAKLRLDEQAGPRREMTRRAALAFRLLVA